MLITAFTGCNKETKKEIVEVEVPVEVTVKVIEEPTPYTFPELTYATVTYQSNFSSYGGYTDLKVRISNTGEITTTGYMVVHYIDGIAYDVYTPKPTYDTDFIYVDTYILIPTNDTELDREHKLIVKFFLDGAPKQLDTLIAMQTWLDVTENIIIQNDVEITINDDEYIEIINEINVTIPVLVDVNISDGNVTDVNISE